MMNANNNASEHTKIRRTTDQPIGVSGTIHPVPSDAAFIGVPKITTSLSGSASDESPNNHRPLISSSSCCCFDFSFFPASRPAGFLNASLASIGAGGISKGRGKRSLGRVKPGRNAAPREAKLGPGGAGPSAEVGFDCSVDNSANELRSGRFDITQTWTYFSG